MHDVAIIGGGLAGLASSIELSLKGYDVVLFEKNQYPFHRVCGEYISNESADYLNHLGVKLEELGAARINRFALSTERGKKLSTNLPLGGIGISRYTLDHELVKISKRLGTTVHDNTNVIQAQHQNLNTSKGDFQARIIIGAQGKRSNIDKQLKRAFIQTPLKNESNFIGVKYHLNADLPKDLIELHLFKDGYCGISAIEEDKYCFCYLSKSSNLKAGMNIEDLEDKVLSKNPILKDYLSRFEKRYDQPKVISQINFQNKEKEASSILFAGDAAGLIAPLSGNGMSMALQSAHLLQKEVALFLDQKQNLETTSTNYSSAWNKAFKTRFAFSGLMQKAFFNPIFMAGLVYSANNFPPLATMIIRKTHGEEFYKG